MTSKREGLPIAALEALMQGLPVLGPPVPGLIDLRNMGVLLSRKRSAEALAEGLGKATPPTERQIQALRKHHHPERMADLWAQIYRDLQTR
jgi:glycosyltransferase involved in cell wall biosynthesis